MSGGTLPQPEPTLTGAVSGMVTNSSTDGAIDGATVSTDTGQSTITQAGAYLLSDVPAGARQVTASAGGFRDRTNTITVTADATVDADFALKVAKGKKPNRGAIRRALGAKNRYVDRFLNIDGVVGAGVGLSAKGEPVVEIYLSEDSDKVKKQIPAKLDDVPVNAVVTGTFEAF